MSRPTGGSGLAGFAALRAWFFLRGLLHSLGWRVRFFMEGARDEMGGWAPVEGALLYALGLAVPWSWGKGEELLPLLRSGLLWVNQDGCRAHQQAAA